MPIEQVSQTYANENQGVWVVYRRSISGEKEITIHSEDSKVSYENEDQVKGLQELLAEALANPPTLEGE